jgi:hypothetical protein
LEKHIRCCIFTLRGTTLGGGGGHLPTNPTSTRELIYQILFRIFRYNKKMVMNIRKFEEKLNKLDEQLWEQNKAIAITSEQVRAIEFLESKGYKVTRE